MIPEQALPQAAKAGLPAVFAGLVLQLLSLLPAGPVAAVLMAAGTYLLVFGLGVAAVILYARKQTALSAQGLAARCWRWVGRWHLLVLAITAGGAVAGCLLFVVIGSLAQLDYSLGELARNGLADGGFYALIWAPGISLVACVMQAYRRAPS
ncbi:MAG: hypothetical protein GVY10_10095 [Verrucomicrobia bacterium]|jgi:hypothetical protein|nr:hypothetical protein [Verrucomicrobiota bacterium]